MAQTLTVLDNDKELRMLQEQAKTCATPPVLGLLIAQITKASVL
jgi:hypothetical protein